MKKLIMMLAAVVALAAACQPEEQFKDSLKGGYHFDFRITVGGFDNTKADATVGWTEGEKVYVFFQPDGGSLITDGYVEFTYSSDGSWTSNSTVADGTLGASGKLAAVYVPYLGDDVEPVFENGKWTIDGGDVYYACASGDPYTVTNSEVCGTLAMRIPEGYVQFSVLADVAADGDLMACNLFDAYTCVNLGSDLKFGHEAAADKKLTGHVDGDRVYFWGVRNETVAENCEFTLTSSVSSETLDKSVAASNVTQNNAYNLLFAGHIFEYTFALKVATDGEQSFVNTTSTETVDVELVNEKKRDDNVVTDGEWLIKSVKVGAGVEEAVNATSFTDKGGLDVAQTATGLSITATERKPVSQGNNDYWQNTSGRTDNLAWSPEGWSTKGVIDLSKYNCKEETTGNAMSTANCYIIRHAGTYKLPLVYGNAVVDGSANEQSYYPGATGGSDRLDRFKNHLNKGITNPFIENNEVSPGNYIAAADCAVVWQDQAEVVKNLQIVGTEKTDGTYDTGSVRYLQFTVSQDDICQNNALVAVKDSDGAIIWSWHIWITNDPALLSAPIDVTNYTSVVYKFFPIYSLGWIEPTNYPGRDDVKIVLAQKISGKEVEITVKQPDVLGQSYGAFYQWGRKDPMCRLNSPATGSFLVKNGNVSLSTAICTPGTFYKHISSDDHNWCSERYYNLWTGIQSEIIFTDQNAEIIKTVYDPSPAGYKVPASKAFTGFSSGNSPISATSSKLNSDGVFNGGWNFYTMLNKSGDLVFFPAGGARNYSDGKLRDIGTLGGYWTSNVKQIGSGYLFSFMSTQVDPSNTGAMAYGFPVRPVVE